MDESLPQPGKPAANPPGPRRGPANPRQRHQHLPPGTGTFGMVLFLIALGMLFAASVLGYILVRLGVFPPDTPARTTADPPPLGAIHVPHALWLSTALILAASYTIHRALSNVRHERQQRFRGALLATSALAVAFLIVQVPSLVTLLDAHYEQTGLTTTQGVALYGLIFFLIIVHGLHLLGGLIPLGVITRRAYQHRYDHEHHGPVKYIALYWHFLDGVWLVMFAVFLIIG